MSFSQLLAAGKCMVGMTGTRSPYKVRAENLLPKFGSKKNPFAPKPEAKAVNTSAPSPADKVAPMETYPLFDAELNPVAPAKSAARPGEVKTIEPVFDAGVCESVEVKAVARIAEPVMAQRRMMQPDPNKGLVDGSPLGLKTGTPTRAPLPAPVVAPQKDSGKPGVAAPKKAPEGPSEKSECAAAGAQKMHFFARALNVFGFARAKKVERKAVQTELSLDAVRVVRNDLSDADLEVVSKNHGKPVIHAMRLSGFGDGEAGSLGRLASRIVGAGQSLVR